MNQIPCVPMMNPYMVQQQTTYMPVPQQPKLNAVNIEINNPSVGTQGIGQGCQSQYAQPTLPLYNYPQAPVYTYPQATAQQPAYYPPYICQPMPQAVPQIPAAPQVATVPAAPQVAVAPAPAQAPVAPQVAVAPAAPAPVVCQTTINTPAAEVEAEAPKGKAITSPMVGTFYAAPSPDAEPFVEVGKTISEGDVVCIVEAMKLMNEIEADVCGRVVEICVENGQTIEFGQVLMYIE